MSAHLDPDPRRAVLSRRGLLAGLLTVAAAPALLAGCAPVYRERLRPKEVEHHQPERRKSEPERPERRPRRRQPRKRGGGRRW